MEHREPRSLAHGDRGRRPVCQGCADQGPPHLCPVFTASKATPRPAPRMLQDTFKARQHSWSTGANTAGKDGPKRRLPSSGNTKTQAFLTWVFWCRGLTLNIDRN